MSATVLNTAEDIDAAVARLGPPTLNESPATAKERQSVIDSAKALGLGYRIPVAWLTAHPIVAASAKAGSATLTRAQRKAKAAELDRLEAAPHGFQRVGGRAVTETRAAQAERLGGRVVRSGKGIDWARIDGKGAPGADDVSALSPAARSALLRLKGRRLASQKGRRT